MKKIVIILCLGMAAACGDPVRITSTVADGTLTAVGYVPVTADFVPGEMIMIPAKESKENAYKIPDDGKIYAVMAVYNNLPDQTHNILLMPGERAALSGHLNIGTSDPNVIISGTQLYETLYREVEEVHEQTKRFSNLERRITAGEVFTPEEQHDYDSLAMWSINYTTDRIRNHPGSPSAAYYLLYRMVPDSCYQELYYGIPESVRNGDYKQLYNLLRPENVLKNKIQQ